MTTRRLIPLNDIPAIQAAGIPFKTLDAARHCYKQRFARGLEDAFVKIGDRTHVDPDIFHDRVRARSAAVARA